MQITEVAFTCYCVTDMPRARKFYEGVLGLKPTIAFEKGKHAWVEYDIGPHTLSLGYAEQFKPSPDGAMVAFEVANFDAAIAKLKEAGTKFAIEPMETPVCRMAMVFDPDGSKLCIHKRKPKA